jgi:hypothetical protein
MEFVDRRALGAIEFVDAITAVRMRGPLRLKPLDERVVITPNISSLYVIRSAPRLEAHREAFEHPPATPPFEDVHIDISVNDPSRRYLPRTVRVNLPRRDAPFTDPESVLHPMVVPMYPAAAAAVAASWAILRVRVQGAGADHPALCNALVVATPQIAGFSAVTAMTDVRGEALVAIAGVPRVLPQAGGGAVLTRQFNCQVEIVIDRRVVTDSPSSSKLADPELIARDRIAGRPEITVEPQPPISLSAGVSQRLTAEVTWP